MTSLQKRSGRTLPLRDLTPASTHPVATVSANLMPPEVIARRRLGWLKRRLAFVLIAIVVLVALGYALVREKTGTSEDQLALEQQRGTSIQQQIMSYGDVVKIQTDVGALKSQLASVMGNDVAWSKLLNALAAAAPRGVAVQQVAAELDEPGQTSSPDDAGAYNPGGQQLIGDLTVSGTASSYAAVSAFADALSRTPGFAQVDPSNAAAEGGKTSFTVKLRLTKAVLGGRFTGGK